MNEIVEQTYMYTEVQRRDENVPALRPGPWSRCPVFSVQCLRSEVTLGRRANSKTVLGLALSRWDGASRESDVEERTRCDNMYWGRTMGRDAFEDADAGVGTRIHARATAANVRDRGLTLGLSLHIRVYASVAGNLLYDGCV